ncbi:MAG: protoporphyrinogen oxidase [Candidatus Caenarcaniphilales bacterium]|nr:protoporphyrinogen oxidase [Candidatus Caenarcaniphilales bacterium]
MNLELAIVGGGMAGLSAAWAAEELGLNFALVEASGRFGGSIWTEKIAEDLVAECGPSSLVPGKVLTKIMNDLSLDVIEAHSSSKGKLVYTKSGFVDISNPLEIFLKPGFIGIGTKMALLTEILRSFENTGRDISVADFFTRHFTQELVDQMVHPMVSGIYAGRVEDLSLPAVFPKIWEWEHEAGSIIRGMLLSFFKPRGGIRPRRIFTLEGGLAILAQEIARWVSPENRFLNYKITGITYQDEKWHLHSPYHPDMIAETLILAVPPKEAARLYPPLLGGLDKVVMAPITTFTFWLSKEDCSDKFNKIMKKGFGFLSAKDAPTRLLGMIFSSGIFPDRAPDDFHAITCFMGGMTDPEFNPLAIEDQIELATIEVSKISGCTPELKAFRHWEEAIPQYQLGHLPLIQGIQENLPDDLALAGNYLTGVSLEDTAQTGLDAMAKLEFL